MKKKFTAFTIDIDWVCEEAIEELLNVFLEYNIKATIFATHDSKVIKNCNRELFEIGLHPNYLNLFEGSTAKSSDIISTLKNIYPESIGIRAHHGVQSTYHSYLYKEMGFKYESNSIYPYNKNIEPFRLWNGIYRIPFNWEDDVHFMYGKSFEDAEIDILEENVILNFHPVHTFINTESESRYKSVKSFVKDVDKLRKNKNYSGKKGVMDLLIDQLEKIRKNNIRVYKLSELIKD